MFSINEIIKRRHSTRNFDESIEISEKDIKTILQSAMYAPSPKNRQPWHFTVVQNKERDKICDILKDKLVTLKEKRIQENKKDTTNLDMAMETSIIMRNSSVLIIVSYEKECFSNDSEPMEWQLNMQGTEAADLQSIGAAIENMILQAEELSIDSLWICDILYAEKELRCYLGTEKPIVAAVALGKASPYKKARIPLEKKISWLGK